MTGLADSLIARIQKQRDLMQAMDEHCQSISARVSSRDENVTVEVDGYGAMTGLWLGDNAHRLGADALASLIVQTAHAAAAVAAERQGFLTEQFASRMRELELAPLTRWDQTVFEPNR
ncbi:YbaB/EbfC DNA-binding family protein [Mycolicibacterium rutilum]|uniref:YbaB/EbfC DNA-binding family protein n=1 Tax=Mycolicibacterium rutilum TaxID=370526 RepID=A0A1H6L245_MYCRU|nr:YbaB/EbfC family nucleoid-associated protein [Mycolicibacterium rutilum]SEH82232.1 YbaB/EbfC DNA-binding family protein [Mycolicibacterium rutilum]